MSSIPERRSSGADPHSGDTSATRSKQRAILSLLLVVLTLAFYNPVAHNSFVYFDDSPYILKNVSIQNGLNWDTIRWAFSTFYAGNWHPLTWISHALDYQLFGVNPVGHHYVSLLFHTANAVLLFLILEAATGLAWPSLMVAALFALHPLNVESVAWAAERKNVLSMFFCLLALWCYNRYGRTQRTSSYIWVCVFFALGLMAKPQIITLPFVLLLWDYWPLGRLFPDKATSEGAEAGRSFSSLIIEKIPLFVLAALSAVVTVFAQRSGSTVRTLAEYSLGVRIENCIVAYARYLAYAFWPAKLTPLYPHPGNALAAWQVAVSALLLFVITAAVLRFRECRYLAMGWFWYLGTLVPVIGLVQVGEQAIADRYVYLPLIGIFAALVWAVWDFASTRSLSKPLLAIPAVVILAALGVATVRQLGHWHDGETLWRYTLSLTERNYMAHANLAMVLAEQNRADEAIAEFRSAEELHQYPAAEIVSLGAYEQHNGHLQGALEQYQKALASSNDPALQAAAWDRIASINCQISDWERAKQAYGNALALRPDDPDALVGAGLLAERGGDTSVAVTQLSHAMRVAPSDIGLILLANALRQAGRSADAEKTLAWAQKLSPNFAQAQQVAGQVATSYGVMLN